MKTPVLIAIAAAFSAGSALAGSVVAPGPAGSLSGSVVALPGVSNAVNAAGGTSGGSAVVTVAQPVTIQAPPAATIATLKASAGAVPTPNGGFTLNNVTINTANGPVLVNIVVDDNGNLTLLPVTDEA